MQNDRFCKPHRRWRDLVESDLRYCYGDDGSWFDEAKDRSKWKDMVSKAGEKVRKEK